jgi:hypothetical protein
MNNMNMNTFNFGKTGIEIGTTLRFIDWSGTEESRPRVEVASKTTVNPLFGDKASWYKMTTNRNKSADKGLKLNEVSRLAFQLETGDKLTDYMAMDLWETESGTVLRTFVEDLGDTNGFSKSARKSKSAPWTGDVNYQTVYSHLRSASDVVRSDIPEAIGYESKMSQLWNDYLDGGEGAMNDRNLTNNLFLKGFVSDCCSAPSQNVAGYNLCRQCKGEFVSSVLEETS